ncbi:hypothetical protein SAMN05421813_12641 [Daejeonella rubra]|uniref:Uncharacterized protein n=1 Tax=Daejeonella rubra TaxID=990371 RepID=A0A1G9WQW0_9SPHI|nr:hypothetical protein [Daejeonella rubra]SDM86820.1 hypothetical protein SAMN05421813_12641 [Daejeonella rubra]
MKSLLGFIFFCFIASTIQAQSASASISITFTDIQSVKFIDLPEQAKADPSKGKSAKKTIVLLHPATSQVRQFDSLTENMENLIQELPTTSKKQASYFFASTNSKSAELTADRSKKTKTSVPLIVYQIDPR